MSSPPHRFIILAGVAVLVGCGGAGNPVTARDLSTGEIVEFASPSDVPPGYTRCGDDSCVVPAGVPCDELGTAVCTLQPECRLKALWCLGGTPFPTDPPRDDCSYSCIPRFPLLCEELASSAVCASRTDCEWVQGSCPTCAGAAGTPCPCADTCRSKAPPLCSTLDEGGCTSRADCEWNVPACTGAGCAPACLPGGAAAPCAVDECGPLVAASNYLCADGSTVAGPTGKCLRNAWGECGWESVSCPAPPACATLDEKSCNSRQDCAWGETTCPGCDPRSSDCACAPSCGPSKAPPPTCTLTDCGVPPKLPESLCPDGETITGPTGKCVATPGGGCGWEIQTCPSSSPGAPSGCQRTGCGGTACEETATTSLTCVWAPHYACYDLAVCTVQGSGCGWVETAAFVSCLASYGKKP